MRKTRLFTLLALLLIVAGIAKAESVTFNVCSWDDTNKKVVTTTNTKDCTVLEGNHSGDWIGLSEGYYVVRGNAEYRVLNILSANVHLILENGAELKCQHIKLEAGKSLYIYSQSDGDNQGKLNVNNNAYQYAAGIGGGDEADCGSLFIHGGNIYAQGHAYGAAIGGGDKAKISYDHQVVIYGGIVKAHAASLGAGIGGGRKGNQGGQIIIYGGDVEARGNRGGAGIGGGSGRDNATNGNGGVVKIYGGKVLAHASSTTENWGAGAGIGGGWKGRPGEVHIYGGDVKAYGAKEGAGIGGGFQYGGGSCEITGGTVFAQGGIHERLFGSDYGCPAIGGGGDASGSTVTITGGKVTVVKMGRGSGTSALIGGAGGEKDGPLTIGTGLKVSWSQDENAYQAIPTSLALEGDASRRWERCVNPDNTYTVIEPCNHQGTGATYTYINEDKHSIVCKACGYSAEEAHHHDGTADCVCGKKYVDPVEYWTITIHKTTDGKTYTTEQEKVVKGKEYMLPVPQFVNGIIFMGYLQDSSVEGIEMKDSEMGALRTGGEVITPNNDIEYYARYRYDYDEEWTWNDECTEATVKISNALLNDTQTLTAAITEDTEAHVEPTKTSLGERHFNATATYNRGADVAYQFGDQEMYSYFYDEKEQIELYAFYEQEEEQEGGEEEQEEVVGYNQKLLMEYMDLKVDATLNFLTLKKDNKLHSICLPFDLSSLSNTPLDGATIYELQSAKMNGRNFTMTFKTTNAIIAGTPYFYRFAEGEDVDNPTFENVIISAEYGWMAARENSETHWQADDESVELWGTFEPFAPAEEASKQFYTLDGDDIKPVDAVSGFEGYFYIPVLTDEENNHKVLSMAMAFGTDEADTYKKKISYTWDGEGTEQAPYLIKTAEQLNELQEAFNMADENVQGKSFKQAANISFDKTQENNFTPVNSFNGHYDGDGYVISGVNIKNGTSNDAALFIEMTNGSTVKNVIMQNSTFNGKQAAAIAIRLNGGCTIENCHVLSDVFVQSEGFLAGGILAELKDNNSKVSFCTSHATVSGNSTASGVVSTFWKGLLENSIYLGNALSTKYGHLCAVCYQAGAYLPSKCYFTSSALSNPYADLMPNAKEDNTTFLNILMKRSELLLQEKNGLKEEDTGYNLTLSERTFIKNGTWNTICLPFNLDKFTNTPFEEATVKALESVTFSNGTLTLNFSTEPVEAIEAGKPYVVKWDYDDNLTAIDFTNVNVKKDKAVETKFSIGGGKSISFIGTFAPVELTANDKSVLYLGANNTLYYPSAEVTINASFAYLKLEGITVDELAQGAKSVVMNFGDETTTGINNSQFTITTPPLGGWGAYYSLDGRRLSGKPTQKGIYIHNGNKFAIK